MSDLSELLTKNIQELAPLIKNKEISPTELTKGMLSRIEKYDDEIHSYSLVTADKAISDAELAEKQILKGECLGPLHGIPIAYKDLIYTADIPTKCASTLMENFVPSYDATVVEKLQAAGSVMLGKLNLTEFALYGYHPKLEFPRNPWNKDHWAGVSSSGSGAATAASLCFASLGTDTGGSIRFPAAACGIVGIKPTFGKVSRYGVFPLADTLDHIGPMARSVWDAAAMLQILEGRDPRDASTRLDKETNYLQEIGKDISGLKIGIDRVYCTTDTDPEMTTALFKSIELLEENGATILELTAPELYDAAEHWMTICSVEALISHQQFFPKHREDYGPVFRALLEYGEKVDSVAYARATRQRQSTNALINELLSGIDVMVCPGMPNPAPSISAVPPQAVSPIEEIPPLVRFSAPTNFSGHPSITLLNGFTEDGLPTSMQFIGKKGEESTLIKISSAYEKMTNWHKMRPLLD